MTLILDIINGLNKFLGYLDISPKYLNRAYTILSLIPTIYLLRIVYGLWSNGRYFQLFLYGLVFLVFIYFIVLNFFYYFRDKNLKGDVTQLFVKYLPDEVFNIKTEEKKAATARLFENSQTVAVDFHPDYQLILADNLQSLIADGKLETNDLTKQEGFLIDENTLYPYYYLKQIDQENYTLQIGQSYQDLQEIGRIQQKEPLHPVGLFIIGGDFRKNGITYHEPYRLKLVAKAEAAAESNSRSRRSRGKQTETVAENATVKEETAEAKASRSQRSATSEKEAVTVRRRRSRK